MTFLVNWDAVDEFLEAIGRSSGQLVFAVYPPDPSKPCRHFECDADAIPRREIEKYLREKPTHNLGLVINPPSERPRNWGEKPEHLNSKGYVKAWGASNAHIEEAIAVWAECDGGLTIEEQEVLPQLAGLPDPTITVWTGGKSLHHYWLFTPGQEISLGLFRDLQTRIANAIEIVAPDAKPDKGINNPSRVMRIPGAKHPKTGKYAVIHSTTQETFTSEEIQACAPSLITRASDAPAKPSHHWFAKLPDERQQELAIEMLKKAPVRTEDGAGMYIKCFAILAGITHHFGQAIALRICDAASWHSEGFWEPEQKIPTIQDTKWRASIRRLIEVALENGYELPEDCQEALAEEEQQPSDDHHVLLPFQFLGYDHGTFYYMPNGTAQVISLPTSSHTKLHLITLGGKYFWESNFPNKEGVDWDSALEWMVVESQKKGVYDHDRIRGRGAWVDANRVIFHLGMRLIVDNKETPVVGGISSYYSYEHAKPLDGPSETPLADEAASSIYKIAKTFSWEHDTSAALLMGWIALAPVCGALDWRPHIWITGGKGCGKTTILRSFMRPLLGGVYQAATGGTTEAGLRGTLRSDAIPVVFDEFEQNEQRDKQNVQNVLALARIASSEGGKVIKGTAGGGSNSYEIRSMFCVSSINVALVQGADQDRFCILSLRNASEAPADHWRSLESALAQHCTIENGRALIARTLQRIPAIRENSRIFAAALARNYGQRFGDQHGTLLAGAYSLQPQGGSVIAQETANKWVDQMDWANRATTERGADEDKCLGFILECLIPITGGRRMSVLELIEASRGPRLGRIEDCLDDADRILGRYGIKIHESQLAIANANTNLNGLLRDTPWSGGAHKQALKRVLGASASSEAIRFPGSKTSRATLIPLARLD